MTAVMVVGGGGGGGSNNRMAVTGNYSVLFLLGINY